MKGDSMDIENIISNEKSLVRNEKYRELVADDFAKKILCDIGLPVNPVYFIHFNINEIDFPSMDNYIVIGDDYGTKICINIDGKILSVDEKEEYSPRYINKDLKSFLECIYAYKELIVDCDKEDVEGNLEAIQERFELIDTSALSDDDNWWSIILEQLLDE